MEIVNGTPETLEIMYDSEVYVFEPYDPMHFPEDQGSWFLERWSRYGLAQIKVDSDLGELKFRCMAQRAEFYRRAIDQHEKLNVQQKEQGLTSLPEPDVVKRAKKMLPLYGPELERLEEKHRVDELDAEAERVAETIRSREIKPLSLTDMTIDDLRQVCRDSGIEFTPRWTEKKLREAISKHQKDALAKG